MNLFAAIVLSLASLTANIPLEPPAKTECELCTADCRDQFDWDSYWIWYVWRLQQAQCDEIQNEQAWHDCTAANSRWLVAMVEKLNKQFRLCGLACCCEPDGTPCKYDDDYIPPFYWEPADAPLVPPNTPPRQVPSWLIPL